MTLQICNFVVVLLCCFIAADLFTLQLVSRLLFVKTISEGCGNDWGIFMFVLECMF